MFCGNLMATVDIAPFHFATDFAADFDPSTEPALQVGDRLMEMGAALRDRNALEEGLAEEPGAIEARLALEPRLLEARIALEPGIIEANHVLEHGGLEARVVGEPDLGEARRTVIADVAEPGLAAEGGAAHVERGEVPAPKPRVLGEARRPERRGSAELRLAKLGRAAKHGAGEIRRPLELGPFEVGGATEFGIRARRIASEHAGREPGRAGKARLGEIRRAGKDQPREAIARRLGRPAREGGRGEAGP